MVLVSEPVRGRSRATELPCCTYVSTVMRSAFADILVPLVPLDFDHDPKKKKYFILTQKVPIRLLLYLTCKLLLN